MAGTRQACAKVIIAVSLLAALQATARAEYLPSFQGLGHLTGAPHASVANGVSADGTVVVGVHTIDNGNARAFRWTPTSGMVALPSSAESVAYAVCADGSAIVGKAKGMYGADYAACWTDSGMVQLPELPGGGYGGASAFGISADGAVIVGADSASNGTEAFRWDSAGIIGLGDLAGGIFQSHAFDVSDDGNVIVGWSYSAAGGEAFRWVPGSGMTGLGDLPDGYFSSVANAVSADGLVIVGRGCSESGQEAVRWMGTGGPLSLGDLPGGTTESEAFAASGNGSVIVGRGTTDSGRAAFIWDTVHGMRSLADVLTQECGLDLAGWQLESAKCISPDGLIIAGYGKNPGGETEAWIARLPEPGTGALGLWAAALLAWRRRTRAAAVPRRLAR